MRARKVITILAILVVGAGILLPGAGASVVDVDKRTDKKIENTVKDKIEESEKIDRREATALNFGAEKRGIDGNLKQLEGELKNLQEEEFPSFILRLEKHSIPKGVSGDEAVKYMKEHAAETQERVLEVLSEVGTVEVTNRLWLVNSLVVKVDTSEVEPQELEEIDGVKRVFRNNRYEVSNINISSSDSESALTYSKGSLKSSSASSESMESGSMLSRSMSSKSMALPQATWGVERVKAPQVWQNYGTMGGGVKVAVLDSGVDPSHPDISLHGWAEFDRYGREVNSQPHDADIHGTHTSGTVSGGDSSGKYIGVAPDVKLIHGKVIRGQVTYIEQIVGGMQWAVEEDADVTSISLGLETICNGESVKHALSHVAYAVKNSHSAGTLVVTSAGNEKEGCSSIPGIFYNQVSVGASNSSNGVWYKSSGMEVSKSQFVNPPKSWPSEYIVPDVVAPGVRVKSSIPTKYCSSQKCYYKIKGTSMAAPHVSGVAALVISASEGKPPVSHVIEAIEKSAWKPSNCNSCSRNSKDTRYGAGIVDAVTAVQKLENNGIEGEVVDGTGSPITDAKIEVLDGNAETDSRGGFKLSLRPGTYTVRVTAPGYSPKTKTVKVSSGSYTSVEFQLGNAEEIGSCMEITQPGKYVLTQDIQASSTCIKIEASNVVFDGNGHVIEGAGSDEAIHAESPSGSTLTDIEIRDVKVSNWDEGIAFNNVEDSQIKSSVITTTTYGVYLEDSNSNVVGSIQNPKKGLQIIGSTSSGIAIDEGKKNKVYHNKLEKNNVGIALLKTDKNEIVDNTVKNNDLAIGTEDANRNILKSNRLEGNSKGFVVMSSKKNLLLSNIVVSNSQKGIELISSSGNTLSENKIAKNDGYGVHLRSSNRNNLNSSNITKNGIGILIDSSDSNHLKWNTVNKSKKDAIRIRSSDDNQIENNEIHETGKTSINLKSSDNNTLFDNLIKKNEGEVAINLTNSSENTVKHNLVDNPVTSTKSYTDVMLQLYNSSDNKLRYNSVKDGKYNKVVELVKSDRNTLMGNGDDPNRKGSIKYGTVLKSSHKNILNGSGIGSVTKSGIKLDSSTENKLINNGVWDSKYGIHLMNGSNRNNLTGYTKQKTGNSGPYKVTVRNAVWENDVGLFVENSNYNDLGYVRADDNNIGILIKDSDHNVINQSQVDDNTGRGIMLMGSNRNRILNSEGARNRMGIVIRNSQRNIIKSVEMILNKGWAYYSTGNKVGNSAKNLTLEDGTGTYTHNITFLGRNVAIKKQPKNHPSLPQGKGDLGYGNYYRVKSTANGDSDLGITIHYTDAVAKYNVDEDMLRMWSYDSSWSVVGHTSSNKYDNTVTGIIYGFGGKDGILITALGEEE